MNVQLTVFVIIAVSTIGFSVIIFSLDYVSKLNRKMDKCEEDIRLLGKSISGCCQEISSLHKKIDSLKQNFDTELKGKEEQVEEYKRVVEKAISFTKAIDEFKQSSYVLNTGDKFLGNKKFPQVVFDAYKPSSGEIK